MKEEQVTGWVGWVGFAGLMMLLGGFFAGLAGFAALFKDTAVYHSATNSVWVLSYTTWGWIHIIAGFLMIVAAGSLMAGNTFGRVFAVIIALLSAFANMAFIPVYPVWSLTIILVDILVIYAVTVHGREVRAAR